MELPRVSLNLSQTECTCECKPGMSLQFVYYTNSSVLVTLKRVHADSSLLMAVMGSGIGAYTRKCWRYYQIKPGMVFFFTNSSHTSTFLCLREPARAVERSKALTPKPIIFERRWLLLFIII